MNLSESGIEYLKAIYDVSGKDKAKVTTLSKHLKVSKPSVVRALKKLNEMNLIIYDKDKIELTPLGLKYANNIARKDKLLQKFFIEVLKIDEDLAKIDAENIKNSVSCHTITKLEEYLSCILDEEFEYENYCICDESLCNECKGGCK